MKKSKKTQKKTSVQRLRAGVTRPVVAMRRRMRDFQSRRPHRTFRMTRRRDYERSLELPGYIAFTRYVWRTLWQQRKLFACVVVTYAILTGIFVGIASQELYTTLGETLRDNSGDIFQGNWGEIGKASLLLLTGVTGGLISAPNEVQQLYSLIVGLLTWLTTVWLLRGILAGKVPRFRDGLYNSGAPVVATMLLTIMLVIQLLPAAIAGLMLNAAYTTGVITGGVEAMLFWIGAALLFALSLYWATSTLIALVVVTLPGMYPWQAMQTAGDMVVSRRVRIMLRWIWMGLVVAIAWIIVMVPIILFDTWLKGVWLGIEWLPIVPLSLLIMSSLTVVFIAAYVYLLYRKVVDDDASPA